MTVRTVAQPESSAPCAPGDSLRAFQLYLPTRRARLPRAPATKQNPQQAAEAQARSGISKSPLAVSVHPLWWQCVPRLVCQQVAELHLRSMGVDRS